MLRAKKNSGIVQINLTFCDFIPSAIMGMQDLNSDEMKMLDNLRISLGTMHHVIALNLHTFAMICGDILPIQYCDIR